MGCTTVDSSPESSLSRLTLSCCILSMVHGAADPTMGVEVAVGRRGMGGAGGGLCGSTFSCRCTHIAGQCQHAHGCFQAITVKMSGLVETRTMEPKLELISSGVRTA